MTISLFILASDLHEFHEGQEVRAVPDSRSTVALNTSGRSSTNPIVNVLVSYDEIVDTCTHEERGMARGNFLYYKIQRQV